MAYQPFQDGTQAFGIPDSPVTINAITYIAEDVNVAHPQTVVEIKDQNGVPTGQTFIPGVRTGTTKLQLATASTARPQRNQTFTLTTQPTTTWVVETVGEAYSQGAYTYCNLTFREKIN